MGLAKLSSLPDGYSDDPSGLVLPSSISTRIREVITAEEWRLVTRTINTVCAPHNLRFAWLCNDPRCSERKCPTCGKPTASAMRRIRTVDGFLLRCDHRELIYSPSV